MAKKQEIQSAAFKRNTLTIAAVVMFGLIVLAEITLAVSIPWYLQREDTMALQVQRLNLRSSFDSARDQAKASSRDEIKQAELRIVRWSLDGMADYLRENAVKLDAEELKSMQDTVNSMLQITTRLRKGRAYSREQRLDTSFYINSLIPREVRNVKK